MRRRRRRRLLPLHHLHRVGHHVRVRVHLARRHVPEVRHLLLHRRHVRRLEPRHAPLVRRAHPIGSRGLNLLPRKRLRVALHHVVEESVTVDDHVHRIVRRRDGNRGVVGVQPAHAQLRLGHVQQSALDVVETRLPRRVLLVDFADGGLLDSGALSRAHATLLAHVGPVRHATGAAVFHRLVALDAPQALHGHDLVEDPEDDADDVKFLVHAVEEHRAAEANLHQRHDVHEGHHALRRLILLPHGFLAALQRERLVGEVRDEQSDDREDVTHGKHRAVNHRQRHRLAHGGVLLGEDELGGFHREVHHLLRLRVTRQSLTLEPPADVRERDEVGEERVEQLEIEGALDETAGRVPQALAGGVLGALARRARRGDDDGVDDVHHGQLEHERRLELGLGVEALIAGELLRHGGEEDVHGDDDEGAEHRQETDVNLILQRELGLDAVRRSLHLLVVLLDADILAKLLEQNLKRDADAERREHPEERLDVSGGAREPANVVVFPLDVAGFGGRVERHRLPLELGRGVDASDPTEDALDDAAAMIVEAVVGVHLVVERDERLADVGHPLFRQLGHLGLELPNLLLQLRQVLVVAVSAAEGRVERPGEHSGFLPGRRRLPERPDLPKLRLGVRQLVFRHEQGADVLHVDDARHLAVMAHVRREIFPGGVVHAETVHRHGVVSDRHRPRVNLLRGDELLLVEVEDPQQYEEQGDELQRENPHAGVLRAVHQLVLEVLLAAPVVLVVVQAGQRARQVEPAEIIARLGEVVGHHARRRTAVVGRGERIVAPRAERHGDDGVGSRTLGAGFVAHLRRGRAGRGEDGHLVLGVEVHLAGILEEGVEAGDDEEHRHENGEVHDGVEVQRETGGLLADVAVARGQRVLTRALQDVHAAGNERGAAERAGSEGG